ncbi:MAG: hypothetical protein JRF37_09155, partial [Deltaproteobacteria bacterium]|nr:hypothetical protein [Deltaproteobacteria bacterium]
MDQQQVNIDYLAVLKRRMHWLIWPPLVTLIGAAVMALFLPNIYKSEATILIENRQISEGLVASTVTTYADQRIQAIKQEVMSRSKILELVKKFNLFPELKEKISTNALTEKVKQSIAIKSLSTAVKTGRNQPGYITMAFNISFEGKNPRKIQQVVNNITSSFFLEKNLKARQASAKGTTKFLDKQVQKSLESLSELNKKISIFKEDHLEELPEFMQLNLQKVDKISQKVSNIDQQLLAIQEQAISVKYKLGFVNPYSTEGHRVLSDEERFQQLELRLLELRSKYSSKHPKVQAIEKEVEALGQTVKYGRGLDQKRTRLKKLRQSLAEDLSKYSEQHPVVKRIMAEVAQLEEEIEATESDVESTGETEDEVHIRNVTNPAYINLQSELDRIELRRTTLKEQKRELNAE